MVLESIQIALEAMTITGVLAGLTVGRQLQQPVVINGESSKKEKSQSNEKSELDEDTLVSKVLASKVLVGRDLSFLAGEKSFLKAQRAYH